MEFVRRYSKDYPTKMSSSKYYNGLPYTTNVKSLRLPNCVTYALGRMCEQLDRPVTNWQSMPTATNDPMFNRTGFGNACDWYSQAIWDKGYIPKLGGILCYETTSIATGKKGLGHVAYVEDIDEARGVITVSASDYSGQYWYQKELPLTCAWIGATYKFKYLGCIYPRATFDVPEVTPVERNNELHQVEVLNDNLRVRLEPSLSGEIYCYAKLGIYNILSETEADNYRWFEIEDGKYIAYSSSWAKEYLPIDNEAIIAALRGQNAKLQTQLDTSNKQVNKLTSDLEVMSKSLAEEKEKEKVLQAKLDNIKKIIVE